MKRSRAGGRFPGIMPDPARAHEHDADCACRGDARYVDRFETRDADGRCHAPADEKRNHFGFAERVAKRRAWALLVRCAPHVPAELKAAILGEVPEGFVADEGETGAPSP